MERNKICSICIDDFKLDSHVRVTPCNHVFHDDCLMTWLGKTIEQPECPNCKNLIKF